MIGRFRQGLVVPAHPLALDATRRLDERRQRALTRYYIDARAGRPAGGAPPTRLAIHEPSRGLLAPVLALAAETAAQHDQPVVLIAGACGLTAQAVAEAELAAALGYHLVLLPPHHDLDEDQLVERARAVGE